MLAGRLQIAFKAAAIFEELYKELDVFSSTTDAACYCKRVTVSVGSQMKSNEWGKTTITFGAKVYRSSFVNNCDFVFTMNVTY